MTCPQSDDLVTRFIDDECSSAERQETVAHLQQCAGCRARVEAEASARNLLHAHAAIARAVGVTPPWRPRVFRLGRRALPVEPRVAVIAALAGAALLAVWLRPDPVTAVGIISDSYCSTAHRFTTRFNVDDHDCTLGCVRRGAEFVLLTDGRTVRIQNQELPALTSWAARRVRVEGQWKDDRLVVERIASVDDDGRVESR